MNNNTTNSAKGNEKGQSDDSQKQAQPGTQGGDTEPVAIARQVDARELDCPLPVLRAKMALVEMRPGEVLEVIATDPHTIADFHIFCDRTGNQLLLEEHDSQVLRFLIQKTD